MCWEALIGNKKNCIFLGESGCGKSELAIDLALSLAKNKDVHLFDLDQTKPLFRARDVQELLHRGNVTFHYEEQCADAPTQVGGVVPAMLNPENMVVMDVGGNDIGAKLIGGYAHLLKREDSIVFYVVNSYRPWSQDILGIDGTLSSILKAAHISQVHFVANPNIGKTTNAQDFLEGLERTNEMLGPYVSIEAACCPVWIYDEVHAKTALPLIPIQPRIFYPWETC